MAICVSAGQAGGDFCAVIVGAQCAKRVVQYCNVETAKMIELLNIGIAEQLLNVGSAGLSLCNLNNVRSSITG